MTPAKVRVLVACFCYGGNSGTASYHKKMRKWWGQQHHELRTDPRIEFVDIDVSDTPIYMTRNWVIELAQEQGFDFVWMIDSDNHIDAYRGMEQFPDCVGFFKSSFEFAYQRFLRGLPTMIGAPYCGNPWDDIEGGLEAVYVCTWDSPESENPNRRFTLELMPRTLAATLTGIHPVPAMGTGCVLFSTNIFEPVKPPYFDYEHDAKKTVKASTEDIYALRNVAVAWQHKINEDVVFCNFSEWAKHIKQKDVGRPMPISSKDVAARYRFAVETPFDPEKRVAHLNVDGDYRYPSQRPVPQGKPAEAVTTPQRSVGGRVVESYGFRTPDEDLDALTNIVAYVASTRVGKPLRIIEVGSWVGESAIAMAQGLPAEGGVINCVDTWEGSPNDQLRGMADKAGGRTGMIERFKANVGELLGSTIRPHVGASQEIASQLEPHDADLIFIDAGHEYEECWADIQAWLPHCGENALMVFHDYEHPKFPGVAQAVNEVFADCRVRKIDGTSLAMVPVAEYRKKEQERQEKEHAAAVAPNNGHVAAV